MIDTLKTIAKGTAGIVATSFSDTLTHAATTTAQSIDPSTVTTIIDIIIKIAIGIVTLWGIFKGKKSNPQVTK